MSVFTYKVPSDKVIPKSLHKEITSIPANSRVTIHALPTNSIVWQGKASRSVSVDLDPGYYSITVVSNEDDPTGHHCVSWGDFFYHECTPEQFKILARLRPRMARGVLGSDGATWRCGYLGCRQTFNNVTAIARHEYLHFGVDPLQDGAFDLMGKVESQMAKQALMQKTEQKARQAGER